MTSKYLPRPLLVVITLAFMGAGFLFSQLSEVQINAAALRLFRPLPVSMDLEENSANPAKVKLGRMLYYETRLSADQQISCNTCHPLDAYGAESKPVSTGHHSQQGTRNAPTVYNAAAHFAQFWDGRAGTIEEQAKGPVTNPIEMAMPSAAASVGILESIPEYVALFKSAFPKEERPVSFENMAAAIGAFERGLVTPSRWDRFLAGDKTALSDAEKLGFNRFVETGCHTCHNGAYVGGNSFQRLGVVVPWPSQKDTGREMVTKQQADRMLFKVPSLRNVTKTAPYFHDGSIATIEQAIRAMSVHQRGATLKDADVRAIETWLETLRGEIPAQYIAAPQLPPSDLKAPSPTGE